MQKKIIHIFDDDKFIDPTIKLFEEVRPDNSIYYVIKKNNIPLHYVKSDKVKRVDFEVFEERNELITYINSDENHVVFLHALNGSKQEIVLGIKQEIKKVWFIWGYDLYGAWPLLKKNIYLAKTKAFLNIKPNLKTRLKTNAYTFYIFKNKQVAKKISNKVFNVVNNTFNTKFYQAASLIDFVVPVVPTEFEIIENMKLKAQFAPFTYGCIEDLLGDKINETVQGKPNILIGNSANPTNNHLDVFAKLAKLNLEGRKIYVPLSYSGNEAYKKRIIKEGQKLFGDNFFPLIDFMSLEKYNEILLSCGTLIFNHVRQQGVGNIIIMGYLGASIYLNKKSPVYKYYKETGMVINEIKELTPKHFQQILSIGDIAENKRIFSNLYSRVNVHLKINTLLEIINKDA